jgi:hypothetical protein
MPGEKPSFEQARQLAPDKERVFGLAEMYEQFPAVDGSMRKIRTLLKESERDEVFTKEMDSALVALESGTELLQLSLKNQREYGLIDKRWWRNAETVRSGFEKGQLAMEMDLRFDADGEIWMSHDPKAGDGYFAPVLSALSTDDVKRRGERSSLEEVLEVFEPFANRGHRLMLELKNLGSDEGKQRVRAEHLRNVLRQRQLEEAVAVASLSPRVLMHIHEAMPRVPLAINGGIVPGFSYTARGEALAQALVPEDAKWRAFSCAPGVEIVVSAARTSPEHLYSQDRHTGFMCTRLPDELTAILKNQRDSGDRFGGLASLTMMTMLSNVLSCVGAEKPAAEMTSFYKQVADELGVRPLLATWGQQLGRVPGLGQLKPERQVEAMRQAFGVDSAIFTQNPETYAHLLPDEVLAEL